MSSARWFFSNYSIAYPGVLGIGQLSYVTYLGITVTYMGEPVTFRDPGEQVSP